jgi:hypothetical protein
MNALTLQLFSDNPQSPIASRNTEWLQGLLTAAKSLDAFATFSDNKCQTGVLFHTGSLSFSQLFSSDSVGNVSDSSLGIFTKPYRLAEMTPNLVNTGNVPANHLFATRYSPYDTQAPRFTYDYLFLPHPYYTWMVNGGDKASHLNNFRDKAAEWVESVCSQLEGVRTVFDYRYGIDALFKENSGNGGLSVR